MAPSYKVLNHIMIFPHHCTKNHRLLIYRLDTFIIERNTCSHCSYNFLKFIAWVVLSYEFPKTTVFGVKQSTARVLSPDFSAKSCVGRKALSWYDTIYYILTGGPGFSSLIHSIFHSPWDQIMRLFVIFAAGISRPLFNGGGGIEPPGTSMILEYEYSCTSLQWKFL